VHTQVVNSARRDQVRKKHDQAFPNASKVTNKKFELIAFDSCLMASVDVANSVKSFGNYMVASEEIEPAWGWDYSSILTSSNAYREQLGLGLDEELQILFCSIKVWSCPKGSCH
jgi:hypothetical protein